MKSRFSALDIAAVVADLQRAVGMRLQNVYDFNAKTYLLKFARTEEKELVLLESGIRLHSTHYEREKPAAPSQFSMKLRKHLRQRRLTAVRQLGRDRVAIFEFGGYPLPHLNYNLVCEFYASGNVVLTDGDWKIVAVLRVVKVNEDDQYRVGSRLASVTNFLAADIESQQLTGVDAIDTPEYRDRVAGWIAASPKDPARKLLSARSSSSAPAIEHALLTLGVPATTRFRAGSTEDLDTALSVLKVAESVMASVSSSAATSAALPGYIIANAQGDYIDLQPVLLAQHAEYTAMAPPAVDETSGIAPVPIPGPWRAQYPTFNAAADAYFSALESQRAVQRARAVEDQARRKLEAIEREQDGRVQALADAQAAAVQRAEVVEHHARTVDAAIAVVNASLAQGMDWIELAELVRNEQAKGNPIARVIARLELDKNQMVMRLPDPWADVPEVEEVAEVEEVEDASDVEYGDEYENPASFFDSSDEEDEGDEEATSTTASTSRKQRRSAPAAPAAAPAPAGPAVPTIDVAVDLGISAMKNVERLYAAKKQSAAKQQKTLAAASMAIKSASLKIKADLDAATAKQSANAATGLQRLRKPLWFEKFHWFVSSENYLVVGGKDAHQNEQLVKRYLRPGDVYIHADLHGAPTIIIKNMAATVPVTADLAKDPSGGFPEIPPSTLAQAGTMALCLSRAWDSKIVTSAYWVWWHQVSKSAPTGEYLTTGSFMIRGRKNMLPPSQLVYGFGIMFRVDEESRERHAGERASRHVVAASSASDSISAAAEQLEEEGTFDAGVDGDDDDDDEASQAAAKDDVAEAPVEPSVSLVAQLQQMMLDAEESDSDDDDEDDDVQDAVLVPAATGVPTESKDDDEEDEGADDQSATATPVEGGAELSRAEIRAQRRAKREAAAAAGSASSAPPPTRPPGRSGKKAAPEPKHQQQQPQSQAAPSPVRGKRGKAKKIKAKYADQSDEERETAMELMQSHLGPQPKGKKEKKKAALKVQAEEVARLREEQRAAESAALAAAAKEAAAAGEGEDAVPQPARRGGKRGGGGRGKAAAAADHEGGEAQEQEEEEEEEEETAGAAATDASLDGIAHLLDSLTGIPVPEDTLMYAVPMCAPYSSVLNFKYKVKLTPGSMKKGKAMKLCLQIFNKAALAIPTGSGPPALTQPLVKAGEREAWLIKNIPEPEWTASMRAQVKVFAPQLAEVQKKGGKGGGGGKKR
ncbi:fibronectin-binding protein A N-terminus-domain-containing protein [Blastocladiella britannica]|nr:fibronectin-binding protein A N-terminus-domain-containing protein [Blastocladiella britannica]